MQESISHYFSHEMLCKVKFTFIYAFSFGISDLNFLMDIIIEIFL